MSLQLLNNYLVTLGWIFALVIILAVSFSVLILLFDKLIGRMDVLKELSHKNMAVAVVLASVIIGASLIIALAL